MFPARKPRSELNVLKDTHRKGNSYIGITEIKGKGNNPRIQKYKCIRKHVLNCGS